MKVSVVEVKDVEIRSICSGQWPVRQRARREAGEDHRRRGRVRLQRLRQAQDRLRARRRCVRLFRRWEIAGNQNSRSSCRPDRPLQAILRVPNGPDHPAKKSGRRASRRKKRQRALRGGSREANARCPPPPREEALRREAGSRRLEHFSPSARGLALSHSASQQEHASEAPTRSPSIRATRGPLSTDEQS